ncbi:hypothetical protein COK70_25825 [Bacillus thuringiensis]|uniref:Uncharacterized protein n=1 Tax=Bacillus thuringiensis TaxID=1428 RepID=A0ABD6SXF7_BACTU|nr:hypothetical protein CN432_30550 [Bacillus thuringiensis]PEX46860.1 hypothetical protein CN461_20195 [Bacillus thuringiensis]PEZ57129.1 hypothetical protein CN371_31380 [Bacillus thuringiensis]PFD82299.1 hypothetical protein CN306_31325 [Bacillus thuringiensis]PFE02821.1 hypothetical protein CN303_30515 [Bacillus thuringiensis]
MFFNNVQFENTVTSFWLSNIESYIVSMASLYIYIQVNNCFKNYFVHIRTKDSTMGLSSIIEVKPQIM